MRVTWAVSPAVASTNTSPPTPTSYPNLPCDGPTFVQGASLDNAARPSPTCRVRMPDVFAKHRRA